MTMVSALPQKYGKFLRIHPITDQDGANASSYPFTAYIADASGLSNNSWAELTLLDEGDGQGQGIYLEKPFVRTENGQYYVMKDERNRTSDKTDSTGWRYSVWIQLSDHRRSEYG